MDFIQLEYSEYREIIECKTFLFGESFSEPSSEHRLEPMCNTVLLMRPDKAAIGAIRGFVCLCTREQCPITSTAVN